jgi:hypothetical protein
MKLYSYVVEHDTGHAPNPYFGVCTLCRCKFRKGFGKPKNVVELAEKRDWIVGTGGADRRKSAGHRKLVYAMRVDEKVTRKKYYSDRRFAKKKPLKIGTNQQTLGDNKEPFTNFEKHEQFALISRHFYYFGATAIRIPKKFSDLEKRGPGFKSNFDPAYIRRFVKWLEGQWRKPGKYGEPCQKHVGQLISSTTCKSSC